LVPRLLEQSPGVSVWFGKINALTRDSFGCGYDIVVPLTETIKGWNKRASVVWKQQTMLGVIPKDTHRANDARTHAYDLLGFYHKEKRSTLVCDLVWNVSLTWYAVDTNV